MSSIEERRGAMRLTPLPAAWRCDLGTGRLSWSAGVYELFGLPAGSALDRDVIVEMYMPESRAALERVRADAIERQTSFLLDAQIVRADGEVRWMRVTADVQCRDGAPVQLYGVKQDITDDVARGLPVFTGPVG